MIGAPADHQIIILAAGRSLRLSRLTRDRPKSLLTVEDKPILGHSLSILSRRGFGRLTLVVGYQRRQIESTLGYRYENIDITYVENPCFAESEHGWSLYCAEPAWKVHPGPVVFMDADNLYDPEMIDRMMACGHDDVMLVDESLRPDDRDDELVLGEDAVVRGLKRGRAADYPDFVGGFVGINRFSADLMGALFQFMHGFFTEQGKMHKYERVFDAFIGDTGARIHYLQTGGLPWINVNREADYEFAKRIARKIRTEAAPSRAQGTPAGGRRPAGPGQRS